MFEYPPFPDLYWSCLTPIEKVKCCFWEYVAEPVITFADRLLRRFGKGLPEDLRLYPFEVVHGYGIRAYFRLVAGVIKCLSEGHSRMTIR